MSSDLSSSTSASFGRAFAELRDVVSADGALSAGEKAMLTAVGFAVKRSPGHVREALVLARQHGIELGALRGAAMLLSLSRGAACVEAFWTVVTDVYDPSGAGTPDAGKGDLSTEEAVAYFASYFGEVPAYVEVLRDRAPDALRAYAQMRMEALGNNPAGSRLAELIGVIMNAVDFESDFVDIHLAGARRAGCSDGEITETLLCAVPIAGIPAWIGNGAKVARS
jgi:4-carboxymuconolactone decarboxylase